MILIFSIAIGADYLTTIGGPFGRASVPQRLIHQSLYQEILLLQKFNDIEGKVVKPKKKSTSNLRKNNETTF